MKYSILALTILFSVTAYSLTKPNEADRQSKASKEGQIKKLALWLGEKTLTCKDGENVTLRATAKKAKVTLASIYGDSGNIDEASTEIQQIQVNDVITLLLSGPDYDEGSALVVMPGSFSQTVGPKAQGFPVLKTESQATALIYGDETGVTSEMRKLDCNLQ